MARSDKEKAKESKVKLSFPKNFNYDTCYVIGKFKLYFYKDEEQFKLDSEGNGYQIFGGKITDHKNLFLDFRNRIKTEPMFTKPIYDEADRVGMAATESYRKIYDGDNSGWFRLTFDEPKYIPGKKS